MKRILAPILLLTLLFPALALGETMDDLVYRDGLYYKKFSTVPFTGKVSSKFFQSSYKNGKRHGTDVHYWFDGQLFSTTNWKDGKKHGSSVKYYENGQLRFKSIYKDGKDEGTSVGYYKNGQLSSKGTYKDGKEVGPWVYYGEDGTLITELTGTYKNGVKVK
jgi:antitoxin component YwqK of YwqJK toxin-antitoxin module